MKTYTIADFKPGDIVYLKSDLNQPMAVSKVDIEENSVKCYWREAKNKKAVNESFPPEVLCKSDERDQIKSARFFVI